MKTLHWNQKLLAAATPLDGDLSLFTQTLPVGMGNFCARNPLPYQCDVNRVKHGAANAQIKADNHRLNDQNTTLILLYSTFPMNYCMKMRTMLSKTGLRQTSPHQKLVCLVSTLHPL